VKGRAIIYSNEELAWIEAHKSLTRRDLHRRFVARFGRAEVSQQNLTALCKRRGWLTGRTGRFVQGQDSWNKGKCMPAHPNSVATRFKKGNRTGRANHVYKPIGTERLSRDGYLERKIHDGLPMQSRWQAVHRINWEALNGPVPEGHALKCLDGDRTNTDPCNWIAVPRALLPHLTGRWRSIPYDTAPPELKPIILAAAQVILATREARRRQADE